MQEVYADQRRDDTPVRHPASGAVPSAAQHRGTTAESARREFKQLRELPWVERR